MSLLLGFLPCSRENPRSHALRSAFNAATVSSFESCIEETRREKKGDEERRREDEGR